MQNLKTYDRRQGPTHTQVKLVCFLVKKLHLVLPKLFVSFSWLQMVFPWRMLDNAWSFICLPIFFKAKWISYLFPRVKNQNGSVLAPSSQVARKMLPDLNALNTWIRRKNFGCWPQTDQYVFVGWTFSWIFNGWIWIGFFIICLSIISINIFCLSGKALAYGDL